MVVVLQSFGFLLEVVLISFLSKYLRFVRVSRKYKKLNTFLAQFRETVGKIKTY